MHGSTTPRHETAPPARPGAGRLARAVVLAASAIWGAAGGADAVAADGLAGAPAATSANVARGMFAAGGRRASRTDPLAMFHLFSSRALINPELTLESLRAGGWTALRPVVGKGMDPVARRLLLTAFPVAVQRVRGAPACRALYEGLGTDGLLVLSTTVYLAEGADEPAELCTRLNANAYTRIGAQTTVVCPAFARLSRQRAAVTLLHEALHYAGMTEWPEDPEGLTSPQISELVRERCGL